jgi:hypothetical protein
MKNKIILNMRFIVVLSPFMSRDFELMLVSFYIVAT